MVRLFPLAVLLAALLLPGRPCAAGEAGEGFELKAFEVNGNTLLTDDQVRAAVILFTGPGRTAADVEKARDALEKKYHEAGYPAVMVNIPEQTLQDGVVRLQVIESRIGRVKVTGNRYFTMEKVMKDLPSFTPGAMLYLPNVQKEIGRLNRSQDIKVDPVMSPGKEVGTIDVDLKVEDQLPLHGSVELNNRSTHDTKDLRLSAEVHYDNLWQLEHSVSLQFQTAPQDTREMEVFGASYVLPAPWERDDQVAFYGIRSNSDTTFAVVDEEFRVIGRGEVLGVREVTALPPYKLYSHNLTLGVDYKHFDQVLGMTASGETTNTPVTYLPLSVSYSASLPDEWGGMTQFNAGLSLSMRGVVSHEHEFEDSRYKATADYYSFVAGVQRTQKLPKGLGLLVKADGQYADQPLTSNEQYVAGGLESVRGYKEGEAAGDEAIHGVLELSFPDPLQKSGPDKPAAKWLQMEPFLFYDEAVLGIHDPLPGQDGSITLAGTGVGVRGSMAKDLEYEVDWAVALDSTDKIKRHDEMVHFKLKAVF